MTEAIAAVEQTPAPISEDDALAAVWDRATADGVEEAAEAPDSEAAEAIEAESAPADAEDAEAAPEAAPEPVEAPSDLPASIKAKWADMPAEAQEAVLASHRDLSRKLADQGRVVQAVKPIQDVLVQAINELPTLRNMTPQQVAQDMFQMVRIQAQMGNDPVKTLVGIAQQYGATEGLRAALGGQAAPESAQVNMALVQEVRQLRAQLQQVADPGAIEARVAETIAGKEVERMVMDYATSKPLWNDAEPIIAQMIPLAQQKLGSGASQKDILDAAYDMAIHADPALRVKAATAAKAPAQPAPELRAAQMKAKAVNIVSRPGQGKPLSEDQALSAVWDKHRG